MNHPIQSRPVENWVGGEQRPITLTEAKLALSNLQLLADDNQPIDAYVVTDDDIDALLTLIENGYVVNRDLPYLRVVGPSA